MAAAQQVELAEVQVSAAFFAELTTADPGSGSGHHGPGDPGPVAGLQHREAVGPGRLQHLAELRFGQRDLLEQRVQGHAAPVRAQDLGDEAAHLRVRHGAALALPRRGTQLRGESKLMRAPGAGAGGAGLGAPGARVRALSAAVNRAQWFRFPTRLRVNRADVSDPIRLSDFKSTATATEWKESGQQDGGSRWVPASTRVRFPSG